MLLDAALRPRTRPLTIAGPAATCTKAAAALDIFGWPTARADAATFKELVAGLPMSVAGCVVTALAVQHNPATSPTGLRISVDGVTLAYSGDAGWSESLVDLARGADLFICGVWWFDTPDETFVDVATLVRHRDRLECRRLLLTHLGPTVLEHQAEVPFEMATDGTVVQL